jgi:hypothetical protein
MLRMMQKNKQFFLNRSNISKNKFIIFGINPMPITCNDIIKIDFNTSSRLVTRHGCTWRKSESQAPIGIFFHFDMGLTPSPRLWVRMLLNLIFHPSLDYSLYVMWSYLDHVFHLYWTPQSFHSTWPLQRLTLTTLRKIQWIISYT